MDTCRWTTTGTSTTVRAPIVEDDYGPSVDDPLWESRPSVDDLGPSADGPFTRAHTSDTRMLERTLSTALPSPSLNSSARVLLAGEPHSPTLTQRLMADVLRDHEWTQHNQ